MFEQFNRLYQATNPIKPEFPRQVTMGNTMPELPPDLTFELNELWIRVVDCFGCASVFETRQARTSLKIRLLSYLGIAIPITIGCLVGAVGVNAPILPQVIMIAGLLGGLQVLISAWALTAKWDDVLASAIDAQRTNIQLSNDYQNLIKTTSSQYMANKTRPEDYELRRAILDQRYQGQDITNQREALSDRERRKATRVGCYQFRRQCGTCHVIPNSRNSRNESNADSRSCPGCGRCG